MKKVLPDYLKQCLLCNFYYDFGKLPSKFSSIPSHLFYEKSATFNASRSAASSERTCLSRIVHDRCWAYVGKTGFSKQTVSLAIPGCVAKGIAAHEFMHVVGFQHEHSRSDRDRFVKIMTSNIQKGGSLLRCLGLVYEVTCNVFFARVLTK